VLPKLKHAKTAIVTLLRAVKKNNFMLLSLDSCPEITTLAEVIPEITQYGNYILKKRLNHKARY
jgi:hypothetical protein